MHTGLTVWLLQEAAGSEVLTSPSPVREVVTDPPMAQARGSRGVLLPSVPGVPWSSPLPAE